MIQGRDAKAAIGAIRRYRASDVGQKMRFVDAQVGDVPYRYTRLDGVDPNWLEPAYGFVGPNLCITSARSLLERLLDEEAPKIEETPAFGGLFSKLGKNLRLAAYLDPAVLPRLQQLLAKMAPGAKTQDPAASKPLEAFSQGVSGLALGAGLRDQKELRVALVISLREEAKGEEEETPRATLTDTTQSGKMAPLNLPAKPEIEH
jgi:hypothetical protein